MEKYLNSVGLSIIAFIFLIFLTVTIISRKKSRNISVSKIFILLLIMGYLLCITEFVYTYSLIFYDENSIISYIFTKANIFLSIASFEFMLALVTVKIKGTISKSKQIFYTLLMIVVPIIPLFFKLNYDIGNDLVSISGPIIIISYVICLIMTIIILSLITINRHKISNVRLLPLYFVFIAYGILIICETIFETTLNDISTFIVMVTLTIYLSFENQDVELLNEYTLLKDEAVKANESKKAFLSSMSHEIRTPLNIIMGYCNIGLTNDNLTDEYIKSSTKDILDSSNELMELISNMVDISKIDNEKLVIKNNEYRLKDIVYEINSVVASKIDKNNLKLNIEIDENIPNVYKGDSYLIFKIINNVLTNAISHTEYGEVKLSITGKQLENNMFGLSITVSNTGHAMLKEAFEKGMEDLFNGDGYNSYINNSMLNLIVAKNLIKKLNGQINFLNEKGRGTNYFIDLNQEFVGEERIGKVFEFKTNVDTIADYSDKKILLCSTNDYSMKLILSYLEKYKVQLFTTNRGKDLAKLIKENLYDAILIDESIDDITYEDAMNDMMKTGYKVPNTVLILNNPYADMNDADYERIGFNTSIVKNTSLRKVDDMLKKVLERGNNNDL